MLLTRAQKEEKILDLSKKLEESKSIILVNYQGLKVNEINALKKKLAEAKINFLVTKNTLFKIALKKAGIEIDEKLLDQPVALIWGGADEVIPAKITVEFGKSAEKLEIIGGIINKQYTNVTTVNQLAALPGREELYAKLVGTMSAPMSRLVNTLQGNLRSLVYILDQYSKQK